MQSAQVVMQSGRVTVDKSVESVHSDDVNNVVLSSSSRDRECRVPRVTNRDGGSGLYPGDPHSPMVICDKYLVMDLVDGSSFYKCVDIANNEEYACKVSCEI